MEKLVNHQTKRLHKRTFAQAVTEGKVRAPMGAFEVPVLTTTNRGLTLAEKLYMHDPLFIVDRKQPLKWSWVDKVLSAKTKSMEFAAQGHEFFIYIDSDDAVLWQVPTVALLSEALKNIDILFQESNHGFPRQHEFGGNKHFVKLFGHKGPCAGAYAARTQHFWKYCNIVLALKDAGSKVVRMPKYNFDDQAAWKAVNMFCSDRIKVDRQRRFFTTDITPNYDEIL